MKVLSNDWQLEPAKDQCPLNIIQLLKACTAQKDLNKGSELHAYIQKCSYLEKNSFIGNTLVNMYAKCGALSKAQQLLEELPVRNMVGWSALIAGCTQQGQGEEALKCFNNMLSEGHSPDAITFTCALKACGKIGALTKGKEIHDKIVSLGMLEKDIMLGSTLMYMYMRCGALPKAQQVLEGLPVRNVIMWNALITGYVQQGQGEEALKCFDDMLHDGYSPDAITYSYVLRACGSIGALAKGAELHDKIVTLGMLRSCTVLGGTLVDMYVKCGALIKAQQVLEGLPVRTMVAWSALIAGYAQNGQGDRALKCFNDMLHEGHTPDSVTFMCALKACGSIRAAVEGKKIHDEIVSLHMLEKDIVIGSTLVDMYVKCGELAKAQQVLEELPARDVVIWSILIAGYAEHRQGEEALKCFDDMLREGHSPNRVTFICVLKACGSIGTAAKGKQIHDKVVSLGMLEKDILLGSTLVDMYVKCGALTSAQEVLEVLPIRDVVTWSALIAGYAQWGQGEEALRCFNNMLNEGHTPDVVTFICVLKACGGIGAAIKGEDIHDKVDALGILEKDTVLGTTLVDMYAKCGSLAKAQRVLEGLPVQDVVTWNTLISGYAMQGQSLEAITCFERMQSKGMNPNLSTFIFVINACGHSGLLDQAEVCFSRMSSKFGIQPDLDHYCCMADLFGRSGKLNKALMIISEMTSDTCLPSWVAILGACRKGGELKIAELAFERALWLDKTNTAVHALMADIYTTGNMQEEVDKIEIVQVAI